jgi:hypothetical protein
MMLTILAASSSGVKYSSRDIRGEASVAETSDQSTASVAQMRRCMKGLNSIVIRAFGYAVEAWAHLTASPSPFADSADRSTSATRVSMSSISIALAECDNTRSAARSRVDACAFWLSMISPRLKPPHLMPAATGQWTVRTPLGGLVISLLELGQFHPVEQRIGRHLNRLGSLVDIALRQ